MNEDNVYKFPPPKRYSVEDRQDDQGNWTVWDIIEVTGHEAFVYIVGEEDPWAGESIDKIIENCLAEKYGYEDQDPYERTEVNLQIYKKAMDIKEGKK